MVKFRGEIVHSGPVLNAHIAANWNNSMGCYYPTLVITRFNIETKEREFTETRLGEHHEPILLERELEFTVDPVQSAAYKAWQKAVEAEKDAKIIKIGRTVQVVRGRKIPIGTRGTVIKMGESNYGPWVVIESITTGAVILNAKNVVVIPDKPSGGKYKVEVTRSYYVTHTVEVEAGSPLEARAKAIEISNDTDHTNRLQLDETQATILDEVCHD